MSVVTNYIVSTETLDARHRDAEIFFDRLNDELAKNEDVNLKAPAPLKLPYDAYGGGKAFEGNIAIYVLNYCRPDKFLEVIQKTAQRLLWSASVQVFYLQEEDELWTLLTSETE